MESFSSLWLSCVKNLAFLQLDFAKSQNNLLYCMCTIWILAWTKKITIQKSHLNFWLEENILNNSIFVICHQITYCIYQRQIRTPEGHEHRLPPKLTHRLLSSSTSILIMDQQLPVQIGQFILGKNLGIGAFGKVREFVMDSFARKGVNLCIGVQKRA